MKALRLGSSGKSVVKVQKKLHDLGFYKAAIDGDYGPFTAKAVRRFQMHWNSSHPKAVQLDVDGVVGPITWGKLFPILSKVPFTKKPGRIIVLDIGHGMNNTAPGVFDPGAVSGGNQEHTWAERIVWALKKKLEARGRIVRVIHDQKVTKRDDIAAGFTPAIFVSNHLDAGGTGVMVLIAAAGGSWIEGRARAVASAIANATGLKLRANRGVFRDVRGLAVLKALPQRTVLIEWGHITSAFDRKVLTDTKASDDPVDKAVDAVAGVLAAIK